MRIELKNVVPDASGKYAIVFEAFGRNLSGEYGAGDLVGPYIYDNGYEAFAAGCAALEQHRVTGQLPDLTVKSDPLGPDSVDTIASIPA